MTITVSTTAFNSSLKDTVTVNSFIAIPAGFQFLIKGYPVAQGDEARVIIFQFLIKGYDSKWQT